MTRKAYKFELTPLALGLAVAGLAPTASLAADVLVDLCATDGTVMVDGAPVPIWGYVLGATCAPEAATLPNPVIRATAGDVLTITLHNNLPADTSLLVPGLPKAVAPMTVPDASGRSRVASFDATAGNRGMQSYTWTVKAGTYLYESGTDVRTQVPMGLYGALVVDAAPGCAYDDPAGTGCAVPYDTDEVLVYSEIDPALNANPGGFGGARIDTWAPKHFLINGKSHPGTNAIAANVGSRTLLRFVNAGLRSFTPTWQGLYMELVAEDGNLYPFPLQQYGVSLPAAKTLDAVVASDATGTYALYDRSLHPGMTTYLNVGLATATPTAVADSYTTAEDTTLTASTGVLVNDLAAGGGSSLPPTYQAQLVTNVSSGNLALAPDGTFTYTPSANLYGADSFTYHAVDTAATPGPNSNTATVTISVSPVNDPPVAVGDSYTAYAGQPLVVAAPGVLGNDSDVDGDALTASVVSPPPGSLTLNENGSFTYTPLGGEGVTEQFTYQACDTGPLCATATAIIAVQAMPNVAPVAVDDNASTNRNTPKTINVVANDTDANGPADIVPSTMTLISAVTTRGGQVLNNGNGTVTYTPKRNFRGTDTFTYTVMDQAGATSNVATVRVNVL